MRIGYVEAILGSLMMAADEATKPANVREITGAMRETTGTWIKLTSAAEREQFGADRQGGARPYQRRACDREPERRSRRARRRGCTAMMRH